MNNEQSVEDFNVSPAIAKPMLAAGVVLFDGNNSVRIQPANYIEDIVTGKQILKGVKRSDYATTF